MKSKREAITLFVLSISSGITPISASMTRDAIFIVNSKQYEERIPRSFRTTMDPYLPERIERLKEGKLKIMLPDGTLKVVTEIPTREGLEKLRISGSAQFSENGFDYIREQLHARGTRDKTMIFVDLREEPHCFLKGMPVSWYNSGDRFNFGKDKVEVEEAEIDLMKSLRDMKDKYVARALKKRDGEIVQAEFKLFSIDRPQEVYSEKYLIKTKHGMGYVRLPITDHMRPEDIDADTFRIFYDSQPIGIWNHFHCAGGKGRTTTLMVLYDMMVNHHNKSITLENYVVRHYLLGGSNLFEPPSETWKAEDARIRADFVRSYYAYLEETGDEDQIYYRTWLKNKAILLNLAAETNEEELAAS